MVYHFVAEHIVGFSTFLDQQEGEHTLIHIEDALQVGPLKKQEGEKFREIRLRFWEEVIPQEKNRPSLNEMEQILHVVAQLHRDPEDQVWVWMAPRVTDYLMYYMLLPYMRAYLGQLFVIPIGGLPFLSETMTLFYPDSFSVLQPKEWQKALKLKRAVPPSEYEVDVYEAQQLWKSNAVIRLYSGGKKIEQWTDWAMLDEKIKEEIAPGWQKCSKYIRRFLSKQKQIPESIIYWRIRTLINESILKVKGDPFKSPSDFDIAIAEGENKPSVEDPTQKK